MNPDFAPPAEWAHQNAWWLRLATEEWGMRNTDRPELMRLRAWLGSPVYWDGYDPVQLEGALQCAVIESLTGRTADDVYAGIGQGWSPPAIPIVHCDELARASSAVPAPVMMATTRWRRKRARVEALDLQGKVLIAGGEFKSLNIPLQTLTTSYLDFFVEGCRRRLTGLLQSVHAIGRDHTRGLGHVIGWEVTSSDVDPFVHEGRLMRPLPLEMAIERGASPATMVERVCGTRAPYWHRASRQHCAVPLMQTFSEVA